MLRACVISFGKNWEKSLPFAEFAYNNSFQSSLNMAPFELLYGRRCRTPLNWSETGERQFFGPDMIKEAEDQVRIVRDQLKADQVVRKATMIVIIGKKATIWMRRLTFGLLLPRKPKDSVSKASWPHVTSDFYAFSLNVEKLPTNLSYSRTFPKYMMFLICNTSVVNAR